VNQYYEFRQQLLPLLSQLSNEPPAQITPARHNQPQHRYRPLHGRKSGRKLNTPLSYTREGVRSFIRALPRDAKVYGLKLDANGEVVETSLEAIAQQLILVEIQLDD